MQYEIIYSKRKSVGIKIKDGNIIVRAPIGAKSDVIERILQKHKLWIEKTIAREKIKEEMEENLTTKDINRLKKMAKEYFSEKCSYYANLMGLSYNRITITSAKTRFGSCTSEKNICFSYRLMLYPEEAREYVVVHELAHLKELNHSSAFYRIVEKYMPDYK